MDHVKHKKTIKTLRKKRLGNDFLDMTKSTVTKEKIDKWNFIKIKNFFPRTPLRK